MCLLLLINSSTCSSTEAQCSVDISSMSWEMGTDKVTQSCYTYNYSILFYSMKKWLFSHLHNASCFEVIKQCKHEGGYLSWEVLHLAFQCCLAIAQILFILVSASPLCMCGWNGRWGESACNSGYSNKAFNPQLKYCLCYRCFHELYVREFW